MNRFGSVEDAKEFLVAQIVAEAQREAVPLSDDERQILYLAPNAAKSNALLKQPEYEDRVGKLIRNAYDRARETSRQEYDGWSEAIRMLGKDRDYLLVLATQAGVSVRPIADMLKVWAAAFAIVSIGILAVYVAGRLGIGMNSELWGILACSIVAAAAAGYLLSRVLLGRKRAEELVTKFIGFFGRAK